MKKFATALPAAKLLSIFLATIRASVYKYFIIVYNGPMNKMLEISITHSLLSESESCRTTNSPTQYMTPKA